MRLSRPSSGARPWLKRASGWRDALARRLPRRLVIAGTACALIAPALVVTMNAPQAQAASSVGGTIARSEVIARAQDWLNRNPPLKYNESRAASTLVYDVDGAHKYGPDCSGMVSMAWHLNPGSSGGLNTESLPSVATRIDKNDLKPGDMLDDVGDGHAILFVGWESDHVHFSYYSFGGNPMLAYTHASFSDAKFASWPVSHYVPYQYKNIVDDAPGTSGVHADFNGDGRSDVGALYDYPGGRSVLFVWLAKSGGGFNTPVNWWDSGAGGWEASRSKLVAGDFNKDGKSDVGIFYDYPGGRTVLFSFLSTGAKFNSPVNVWDSGTGGWDQPRSKPFSGDFNHDGYGDVGVIYDYPGGRTVAFIWTAKPTGGFNGPANWWDSGAGGWEQSRSKPVTGDFTGDGRTDLGILYDYPGGRSVLFVFASTGTSFASPVNWWDSGAGGWEQSRSKLIAGDFNKDGKTDVGIFYDYPGGRTVLFSFLSTGSKFAWPVNVWDSGAGGWEQSRSKPVSGDFNGDGYGDAAILYDYPGGRTVLFTFTANANGFAGPVNAWDSGTGGWEQSRTNPV
jgi:hypothetical protein